MPKVKISEFDIDPANNTDINSINIAEGCAPSGINNAIRQLMSDLKEQLTGASGDPFTVGGAFAANGGATLGDASGDALTINSSAVSIPNGLNFDSNTLVIDATNNRVGVGTASPSVALDIAGTVRSNTSIKITKDGSDSVASGGFYQLENAAGTRTWLTQLGGSNSYDWWYYDGSAWNQRMRIDSSGNVGIGTSSPAQKLTLGANNAFRMQTGSVTMDCTPTPGGIDGFVWNLSAGYYDWAIGGTSRMRIDSSGNLLVGTTSASFVGKQVISYNGALVNGIAISESANTSGTSYLVFYQGSTVIGTVARVGATSAVVYNTTSDERLKSNIEDAEPVINKLMNVKVRQYDWTEGNLHQEYGFIAQELEPVLSGVVTKGKTEEDMWQVDYARLTPHLVKAIQEQQAIITDLKARIETLESK